MEMLESITVTYSSSGSAKVTGVTGNDTGGQIGQVCPISLTENWPLIATDLSLEGNGNHNSDLSTCVSAQENYFSY